VDLNACEGICCSDVVRLPPEEEDLDSFTVVVCSLGILSTFTHLPVKLCFNGE
jgi:hypothetical protein